MAEASKMVGPRRDYNSTTCYNVKDFWQRLEAARVRRGMKLKHCCETPLGFRKVIPTAECN